MFSTLALICSFLLWKAFTGFAIIVMYFIIFLVFAGVWALADEDEHLSERSFVITMVIALFISIPFWDWMHTGSITTDARNKFTQGWGEYNGQVEREAIESIKPTRTDVGVEIRRYELVGWNPPKHFYVTLEDVQTHEVYGSVYVSKHCNSAYSLKKGEEYNITVTKYTMSNQPGKVFQEFNNLYSVFCS